MKTFRAAFLAGVLGATLVVPVAGAPDAQAHGWVTSPPSRQDTCATGAAPFDCGTVKYEPQSVEAPKGSMQCSGGNPAFAILDDASKPWPVTSVGPTLTVQWKLTAAHSTSLWEYFVDGRSYRTFDQGGAQPSSTISHTLTNLPAGRHTILARWNVSNTTNAFYSCIDVLVGEPTEPGTPDPTPSPTDPPTTPPTTPPTSPPTTPPSGQCAATPWSAGAVYVNGDVVSAEGRSWRAKWWTTGERPGTTGTWGVWADLGPCTT
ncbi:lytic polysaccharide monooxygenase [Sanguibacter sp. 25GB23B1]|uniref:lytic polysaccharide monooxygenase n=1 Tax=unclassified Sanguibacter TaxID=2645534 RepID=UPI0032B01D97